MTLQPALKALLIQRSALPEQCLAPAGSPGDGQQFHFHLLNMPRSVLRCRTGRLLRGDTIS